MSEQAQPQRGERRRRRDEQRLRALAEPGPVPAGAAEPGPVPAGGAEPGPQAAGGPPVQSHHGQAEPGEPRLPSRRELRRRTAAAGARPAEGPADTGPAEPAAGVTPADGTADNGPTEPAPDGPADRERDAQPQTGAAVRPSSRRALRAAARGTDADTASGAHGPVVQPPAVTAGIRRVSATGELTQVEVTREAGTAAGPARRAAAATGVGASPTGEAPGTDASPEEQRPALTPQARAMALRAQADRAQAEREEAARLNAERAHRAQAQRVARERDRRGQEQVRAHAEEAPRAPETGRVLEATEGTQQSRVPEQRGSSGAPARSPATNLAAAAPRIGEVFARVHRQAPAAAPETPQPPEPRDAPDAESAGPWPPTATEPSPVPPPRWSSVEPSPLGWQPVPRPDAAGDVRGGGAAGAAGPSEPEGVGDGTPEPVGGGTPEADPDADPGATHPYTWVQMIVLVLVAFVLGMLIFRVVVQGSAEPVQEQQTTGAAMSTLASQPDPSETGE